MHALKWTPAVELRYRKLQAKVNSAYETRDRNTDRSKQRKLDKAWCQASQTLDAFCERHM